MLLYLRLLLLQSGQAQQVSAPVWSPLPIVEYTQGSAWTHKLTAYTEGSPTPTFVVAAGALPVGITLNADGSFDGVLTNSSGSGTVTFIATNSEGAVQSGVQAWLNKPSTYPDAPINLTLTEVDFVHAPTNLRLAEAELSFLGDEAGNLLVDEYSNNLIG